MKKYSWTLIAFVVTGMLSWASCATAPEKSTVADAQDTANRAISSEKSNTNNNDDDSSNIDKHLNYKMPGSVRSY